MSESKPLIYFADLRHTRDGVLSNACMPLGVGYMKAVMDRDLPAVESRIFARPEALLEAMDERLPQVLLVSNYVWNESLAWHFVSEMKRRSPATLTVMGGPNLPMEPERQRAYLDHGDGLDAYVMGEGDLLATEIVSRWLEVEMDHQALRARGLPSCIHRDVDGEVVIAEPWQRSRNIEHIPSPWTTGVMDEFFDGKMIPLLETNRGCPFTCTFCVQGTAYYNRIAHFDEERVKADLTYVARKVHTECPQMGALTIADPNYGMYERDVTIAEHLGKLKKQYKWPSIIDASSGKNAPEKIIRAVEQASGALTILHAVQSMDEDVLRNVKRSNIRIDAYEDVSVHLRSRGLRSVSQTILGLPGETLSSHLTALDQLMDSGIDSLQNFQLLLIQGSEMETAATREEYGFETMFRLSPRGFGEFGDARVFDTEEVVVGTATLGFDDYLQARRHHLACIVFWNQDWFAEAIQLAGNLGVSPSRCMAAINERLFTMGGTVGQFLEDFTQETRDELFESRRACEEFYRQGDNFERLARSEIGDNLMNKYRAIASFHLWPELNAMALEAILGLLPTASPGLTGFWSDFSRFSHFRHAHGHSREEILMSAQCDLSHDIPAWIEADCPADFARFRFSQPQRFDLSLSAEGTRELGNALDTWGLDIHGLTRAARHLRVTCQQRSELQRI